MIVKKNSSRYIVVFFVLILISSGYFISGFSQTSSLNLDEILDKHAEATGLESRLKVNTLISYGKIEQLGTTLDVTIIQKRPDKYRMDVHFDQGRITQAFDGKRGWSLNPFVSEDTIAISGLELDQLRESALFDGILFNAPDLGFSITFSGEENIVTKPSYVILLKKKNGDRLRFFIDKQDFLIKRTEATFFFEGMLYEVNSTFSNFKNIAGMTLPFTIQNNNGQLSTQIKIDQIKINENIEDGLFTGKKN